MGAYKYLEELWRKKQSDGERLRVVPLCCVPTLFKNFFTSPSLPIFQCSDSCSVCVHGNTGKPPLCDFVDAFSLLCWHWLWVVG
jgi:hypothetical protein